MPRRGDLIKLNIFDTAGEEKYQAVTACHYRKAKGAVIVYDVTNRKSFENLEKWLDDVKQLADHDCMIMVMGNKNDVDGKVDTDKIRSPIKNDIRKMKRQVTTEEGIEIAKKNHISFFEVSALEHKDISKAFQILADQILNHYHLD